MTFIKEEMVEVKKKFGDERKTDIEYLATDISIEDLIEEEDVVITVSHLGYIKRTSAYRISHSATRWAWCHGR
jgi:DNA gyrase subunit A